MSARSSRFSGFGSRRRRGKAAGAVFACAVMLLAGCGGSGGSAADAGAPIIRGTSCELGAAASGPLVFSGGPLVVTNEPLVVATATSGQTVTFDRNGGSGTMPSQTSRACARLHANAFAGQGHHVFNGWATSPTGIRAYANTAIFGFASNVTLYAVWALPSVTFDPNGGGGTMPAQMAVGWTHLHLNTFTSPQVLNGHAAAGGWFFRGWSEVKQPNSLARIYLDGDWYPFTAVTTLYAQWTTVPAMR